jgi:hypothetical protein
MLMMINDNSVSAALPSTIPSPSPTISAPESSTSLQEATNSSEYKPSTSQVDDGVGKEVDWTAIEQAHAYKRQKEKNRIKQMADEGEVRQTEGQRAATVGPMKRPRC